MKIKKLYPLVVIVFLACCTNVMGADDLNDGISNYTDARISKDDDLGGPDTNVEYIMLYAKSRVSVNVEDGVVVQGNDSTGNINSVVVRPGAYVFGDIIIIDQSTAAKSIVIGSGALSEEADLPWP